MPVLFMIRLSAGFDEQLRSTQSRKTFMLAIWTIWFESFYAQGHCFCGGTFEALGINMHRNEEPVC